MESLLKRNPVQPDEFLERVEREAIECKNVKLILSLLDEREKFILEHRYGLNDKKVFTLKQLASIFEISLSRISQIEKKAILRLRQICY